MVCYEDKHEGCSSGGLCAAVIAGACVLLAIINPLSIASAATGSTEMTMQADDSQISWTVPVTVTFAVNGDGTFQVPTNGQFTNNSVFDIHVSNIAVSAPSGVNLAKTSTITSATAADTIGFTVTPGSGTAIEVADYTTAAATATAADWVIEAGSTLAMSYAGKMSSYGSLNPASAVKVATITWTAAAGGVSSYTGPSLADSSVAVSLTLAQLQEAKADSSQAANLEAYAQSAKLQVQVPMADSTTKTATLIEDNDAGLTFMMDDQVGSNIAVNSTGPTTNTTFSETELYAALQSDGSVYNLFDSSFLSAITPQSAKVASVYNETDGTLTTLSNQTLWLPASYDIDGADYASGYTAGSSAEATFGHQLEGWANYTAGQSGSFWLRSAYFGDSYFWLFVQDGSVSGYNLNFAGVGVRPCFTL